MQKKLLCLLLVLVLSAQLISPAGAAVIREENGEIAVVNENGEVIETGTQTDWEEDYPYGIFAFRETQVNLKEGAEDGTQKGTLTLYRLGGTEGRAEALVTLSPVAVQVEEERISYAYAAGTRDYRVSVEDPWPCAWYQAPGGSGELILPGGPVTVTAPAEPEGEEGEAALTTLTAPVTGADSYAWQLKILGPDGAAIRDWSDIEGAKEAELVISAELLTAAMGEDSTCDFRCVYEADGVKYCSESRLGEAFVPAGEDAPPAMPEDFVDDHTRTETGILFDGEEFGGYSFLVVFADGEWEKEITFEALDDGLSECGEMVSILIAEARGAEIHKNACTASLAIEDDEPEIPSAMGFAETEIWADKAAGTVRIPLLRESEGLQYVTGADYETVNGTAEAGRDYAAAGGTVLFPSDLDYSYIEIDLVNDGAALEREDSELYFTLRLTEAKGGGGSTLLPGRDTVTVRLYNSAEGEGEDNLATALYSPDEEDLTGAVGVTSAIVPAGGRIGASAAAPAQDARGEYAFTEESGASLQSYTYPGVLDFGVQNGGSFWTDYALLASEDVSAYFEDEYIPWPDEADDHEGFQANRQSMWSVDGHAYTVGNTGWAYYTERGGKASTTIANMYDRYESVKIFVKTKSDCSSGGNGANDKSTPYFSARGDNNSYYTKLSDSVGKNRWEWHTAWQPTQKGNDRIWFKMSYSSSWPKGDANCRIELYNGYMARRWIDMPIVQIHTADDAYLQDIAPSLHEAIKPVISLVAGKGGTNYDGSYLYNNSQLRVTRGNNASSYAFASQMNGSLNNKSLFLSTWDAASAFSTARSSISSGDSGTLTVLLPGDEAPYTQSYINVVMDRQQNFSLEISPSVPRLSEEDSAINTELIGETWDSLWEKAGGSVTYRYREVNWDFSNEKDGFSEEKEGTLTKAQFVGSGSLFRTGTALKNVRSVNFHLNEDDVILVNGIAYAGNEDIPIPASLYLNDKITFSYYDADYVTGTNTMLATVSRVERYVDLNDDGVIGGGINAVTGEYMPDEGEVDYAADPDNATYFVLPSLTNDFYSITQLAPRLAPDGKRHQIVLKVYYSLLPRSLVVPAGATNEDTAEIVPAFVTAITSESVRSSMSREQKGYRYIDHGGTGDGKLMYEARASAVSTVDIPLGGDYSPGEILGETAVWTPDWRGNPYPGTEFTNPEPIYLNGTALGDRYPVGEETAGGGLTAAGKVKVANYLSSMQENDTFALCVRETPKNEEAEAMEAEEETNGTTLSGVDSSRKADLTSFPGSTGARELSDVDEVRYAGFDSSAAGGSMSEYNMSGDINLPELELSLTDFVSISTNGQELAISIGCNVFGVGMESDLQKQENTNFKDAEVSKGPADANGDSIDSIKQAYNSLFGQSGGFGDEINDKWNELKNAKANKPTDCFMTSKQFEVSVAVGITILLKWDPIENRFFFNQCMVMLAAELEFSYTVYLTPCPIFYVSVTIGFGLEAALGVEASRVKVKGSDINLTSAEVKGDGWTYYTGQEHMGYDVLDEPEESDFLVGAPGASFTYTTKEKALDIHFSGKLYVEAVEGDPKGFSAGTISSAGDEAVTIKLAKKVDGRQNSESCTLKFTVVGDENTRHYDDAANGYTSLPKGYAIVDRIVSIKEQKSDVYFAGFSLSPELSMEFTAGAGVECLKVELFINISVGCSFAFGAHDSEDYYGEEAENKSFVFNEFSFAASVGIRVVALLFNFEFNAVQFTITYDREIKYDEDTNKKTGWNFMWYAANRQIHSYKSAAPAEDGVPKVKIVLPGETVREEELFTPEKNMESGELFAYDPSDSRVPFQYSGYGTGGDAFALGSGLVPGSTYELVTANGANYIVYTITDGSLPGIHQSRVVLSKVQETAVPGAGTDTVYGLVNPVNGASPFPFLELDDDAYGDLDFDAWVDDAGMIRVAWVSYTEDALDAYTDALDKGDSVDAMAACGRNTQVKTVSVDPAGGTVSSVQVVSDNAPGHGMYSMPAGAGDMVFYAEACYYADAELTAMLDGCRAYYGVTDYSNFDGAYYFGEDDPTSEFRMTMKRMRAQVYGKSFYPTYAVAAASGYAVSRMTAQDWIRNGVQLENVSLTKAEDGYYAAFSTAQTALTADGKDEQTIKKLYLQKLTVSGKGAVPGKVIALRKLVDNDKDSSGDGVYAGGSIAEACQDPYFANVQFLKGRLGGLTGTPETFDEQVLLQSDDPAAPETFLIFEMNGNTYVVPQASLEGITGSSRTGCVIPFFTRETAGQLGASGEAVVKGAPAVTNVTVGADGNGNIAAVYTRGVSGAPGNAVYLTKYDPKSMTWGLGTRLAMRDMDTIEEAEARGLSADETAALWYDTNGDGRTDTADRPSSFTFSRLRIGLAGTDKLLVVAEGTLMALEAAARMRAVYDADGKLTGLAPETDDEDRPVYTFRAKQTDGVYETTGGVYALSFGMGGQGVGSAALHLSNFDLTPGSAMTAGVSFVNSGDVAIRASERQPAVVTLYAGGGKLAEWFITENVRAGQEVYTDPVQVTLPPELTVGDKIYFTVNEDTAYIGDVAFSASTVTGDGEADTPGCITVANRVELGYEDFDVVMVGADKDTVTLAADIHVGNRGSAVSSRTYLHFQYEKVNAKGETEVCPIDLTGHRLSVSNEEPLSLFAEDDRTLSNGYLLLRTMQDGEVMPDATSAGQIRSMYGRTVTGTFTVPKSCYDTGRGTGSLNLRVTIESYDYADNRNTEYNSGNNLKLHSVEPVTLMNTVNSVSMQVGSSLRLPLNMQTSTLTAPAVTVTEMTDDGSRNLGVLYYDANQEAVVVMPAAAGEGKIRVADTATNSFHDICYKIEGEGVGLNIFDDNGIFTWTNASGYSGDAGHGAWDFKKALVWAEDLPSAPMRSDLAIATKDESFSFRTLADSIDLYFMGTNTGTPAVIEVSSNIPGFETRTYTSANGEKPVTVDFGNVTAMAHTVTVRALSEEVRFDRLEEFFSDSLTIQTDPTAPGVYWSRTLPGTAAVKTGDAVDITVYFADLGGLGSVTMNGEDVTARTVKDGKELWALPLSITENGSWRFVATDSAGNTTTRDLSVDWFSSALTETADPGAPDVSAVLTFADGTPIPDVVSGDVQVMLQVTRNGVPAAAAVSKYQYDNIEDPGAQYFAACDGLEPDEAGLLPVVRGVYRVAVKDESTGVTGYCFVNLNEQDADAPLSRFRATFTGFAPYQRVGSVTAETPDADYTVEIEQWYWTDDISAFADGEIPALMDDDMTLQFGRSYVVGVRFIPVAPHTIADDAEVTINGEPGRIGSYSGAGRVFYAVVTALYPSLDGEMGENGPAYTLSNVPTGARLVAARYEEGRLTDLKIIVDPLNTGSLTMGGSGDGYKLFLLDSKNRPLCPSWSS
jgi:hypothetical protein